MSTCACRVVPRAVWSCRTARFPEHAILFVHETSHHKSLFRVILDDGAAFLQHTAERYDVLLLDAYTRDGIPDHLGRPEAWTGSVRNTATTASTACRRSCGV